MPPADCAAFVSCAAKTACRSAPDLHRLRFTCGLQAAGTWGRPIRTSEEEVEQRIAPKPWVR
jgi:hypothetical protein